MAKTIITEQEVVEDRIIDLISPITRLIIFRPKEKTQGVDLIVKKRAQYGISGKGQNKVSKGFVFSAPKKEELKEIFLQVHFLDHAKDYAEFLKDFPADSLRPEKDLYFIFVCYDEVREELGKYIWVVPSLEFENIANRQTKDGKIFLRFQTALDIKKLGKFSKFSVDKENFGTLMLEIVESKGAFRFSSEGAYVQENVINLNNLKAFIVNARQNTYAASLKPADNPRLLKSNQLEFQKSNFFYRDIYFAGKNNIIGQEIVYFNNKPAWGMNYIGKPIRKEDDKYGTPFLKEALFKLAEDCRFFKECDFQHHEFQYRCKGQGSLENFSGQEEVIAGNKSIFKLSYQGGLL